MGIIRVKRTSKSWFWRPRLEALEARRLLSARADFNGDGYDDLAIGAPGENNSAGLVHVLYGSPNGLTATGSQTFSQSSLGTDSSEAGDRFGSSLAAGDFNNDGRDDLAVGIPGEDIGAVSGAGAVSIIFGSPNGLTGAWDQFWHQDSYNVPDVAEAGDQFGNSLATGDFNGDNKSDLAVGVAAENVGSIVNAGLVQIFHGRNNGVTYGITPSNLLHQGIVNVPGTNEAYDNFGWSLASADFNGDGKSDLAVGVPYDNFGSLNDAGAVNTFYGADAGLTATGSVIWNDPTPSANAYVGWSLAAGYVNEGNTYGDIVIGAPGYDSGDGRVFVDHEFGNGGGLQTYGGHGYFGWSVAVGTFFGDFAPYTAFVAGAPFDDYGSAYDAGSVFGPEPYVTLVQENMGGFSEASDNFGWAVATGDFDNNDIDELVVGARFENYGTVADSGAVYVCGDPYQADCSSTTSQVWHQDIHGVDETAEAGDHFGYAFAVGADVPLGGTGPSGGGGGGRPMSADILNALEKTPSTQTTPDVPASRRAATVRPTAESESDSERTDVASVKQPVPRVIRPTPTSRDLNGLLSLAQMFADEISPS